MEQRLNTSFLDQKSYISPSLANYHQHDDCCQLFENFIKINITQSNAQPYDPKCFTKQYNVIVEGVVFNILSSSDIENQFIKEKIESEE
ncbi:unnamed protein product [Paramecium pentaurelia]|uniref:Uncharacterized protein n=1 Tax=Paramecium pentaurelia TaxID=43138 RepID=A0A8S1WM10_9CILI|nr:unnamed protein product [Paramecium pentaurelia]